MEGNSPDLSEIAVAKPAIKPLETGNNPTTSVKIETIRKAWENLDKGRVLSVDERRVREELIKRGVSPIAGESQSQTDETGKDSEVKRYHEYFDSKRPQIKNALSASYETPYGEKTLGPLDLNLETVTYEEFASRVPLIKSSEVATEPMSFVRGDVEDNYVLKSGGTTGKPKEFYIPKKEPAAQFKPGLASELVKSKDPVFLHGDWFSSDFVALENGFKQARPDIRIETYQTVKDALEKIKTSDLVFFESDVTSFRIFTHYLDQTLKDNPQLAEDIKGKQMYIELNSEPVKSEDLKIWYEKYGKYFGKDPIFNVTYGQNDTGFIGFYEYTYGDTDRDIKYEVSDKKLLEVLDEQGNLVINQRGKIVLTTLRDSGSVFVRYPSGDEGLLSFDSGGRAYISEVSRAQESGMISLWGNKLFVPTIVDRLKTKTNLPFQLEAQILGDESGEHKKLMLNVYSDAITSEESGNIVKEQARLAIVDEFNNIDPELMNFIEKGMLDIVVTTNQSSPEGFMKSWRILPQESLEANSQQ